ncbi:hypothetical protein GCM10027028_26420 [Streptomyces sundarbansensis]
MFPVAADADTGPRPASATAATVPMTTLLLEIFTRDFPSVQTDAHYGVPIADLKTVSGNDALRYGTFGRGGTSSRTQLTMVKNGDGDRFHA